MPLTRALLTSLCAASLLLPTAPLRAAPAEDAQPTDDAAPEQPATPGADPEPTTTPPGDVGGDADAGELQDAMVRAFTERFQEGKFLFNRGSYAQAAAEFERAFASIPAEAALFNVALSYERARDYVSAATAARRYMQLPDCAQAGVDPALCGARRAEVEAQLDRLMAQIGELRLQLLPGVQLSEVAINGRKVALEDFPVLVAAGRVDIEVVGTKAGQRRQRVIDVRAGERQAFIVVPFERDDETRPDPSRDAKPRPKWLRPMFWSALGVTALSGIAMTTMGSLMLSEKRKFEKGNFQGAPSYPADHERRAEQYQMTTNVLVGVTAGLALVTTVVGIVAFTGEDARRRRNAGTQRASTRVRWQPGAMLIHF